jgi:biotin operon repressor
LNRKELNQIFKLTMLIHENRNAARILALTMKTPLSAQQITKACGLSPMNCQQTIKKLKAIGLVKVVKKVVVKGRKDAPVFFYKAQLNPKFVCFKNGRFHVKFPAVFRLSNGEQIDFKALLESCSTTS